MFGDLNIRDTVRPAAEGKGTTGMLPTFVIGLREGVEAALIVGIIAAFLIQRGERKAIRSMWLGVAIAIALCIGVAVVLSVIGENLPFKQREIMEGVLALIAVAGVTYMIIWMRRHSRGLKGILEENAAAALVAGSSLALIGMAFFAVIREGLETAIFMLAAFQNSTDPMATGLGAVIGVVVAVALGYAIYKGGVRINLSRFFRIAVHSLSEAGVVTQLQSSAFDLTWLVAPGSVRAALLTGMLGLQPVPTTAEMFAWLLYAIPMGAYVLWPQRSGRRTEQLATPATTTA
jgi:high-affinity iron transporter